MIEECLPGLIVASDNESFFHTHWLQVDLCVELKSCFHHA